MAQPPGTTGQYAYVRLAAVSLSTLLRCMCLCYQTVQFRPRPKCSNALWMEL